MICTDKTGTLTQNEMTVREVFLLSGRLELDGVGYTPEGAVRTVEGAPPPEDVSTLFTTAGLACNARLVGADGRWTVLGDPTEGAILVAAAKAGVDLEAAAERTPWVFEVPFDSRRKRMSTIHRDGDAVVLCAKGAPRELLARCALALVDGVVAPLDEEQRARISAANDDLSRRGLRVLAVARRVLPGELRERTDDVLERELTFLGLVAMMDPPRPEVEAAVPRATAPASGP